MINSIILHPLQVSATDFNLDSNMSTTDLLIAMGVLGVIIGALVIINKIKKPASLGGGKPSGSKASGSSGSASGLFSGFTVHRIAKNLGLNHEQSKMLDYVLKTDQVIDPQRSINTPALLDRHFRRAYRIIEQQAGSRDEIQRKLGILFSTRNVLENSVLGSLSSTNQIKDDTTFILNTGKDKINVSLIYAKGDNLLVDPPKTVLGSMIKLQRGTRLTVLFFNKSNKGFSFETRVTGYSSHNGHPAMQLAHSNQIRFLSQRRFRRRQTTLACNLFLVYVEGSGKKQRLIVDKRRIQGNVADISVGGCSIKTMSAVQVGARFKIEFTLGDENVAALGQVLRSNRTGVNTVVHIKFLKVSQKSMNLINAYVYEYGRE